MSDTQLREALEAALVELYNCGYVVGADQDEMIVQQAVRRADQVWIQGREALAASPPRTTPALDAALARFVACAEAQRGNADYTFAAGIVEQLVDAATRGAP